MMKLIIEEEPIIEAKIKKEQLWKNLFRTRSLEQSIKNNLCITKNSDGATTQQISRYLWLGLDWGKLLEATNQTHQATCHFKIFEAQTQNMIKIIPHQRSNNTLTFTTQPAPTKTCIITQNIIPNHNFNIEQWFNTYTYDYSKKAFKKGEEKR